MNFPKKVSLKDKFLKIKDYWSPKVIGELNGQWVKIAKVKGEFIWHHHEVEDELFYVLKGALQIEFRDKTEILEVGDMLIVPKMVEHKPSAKSETWIILFEPKTTLNTGNVVNEYTLQQLEKI